ncbi:CoA-binding domain-containing protein [Trichococcus flocculiformis]|uniref:polysaccharide biosynthesis protein n=1 Tax=Trichococcus TaxID=82802 RepID=UPI0007A7EA75|nr:MULTISPECIES: nucleoside-diphosphate sugar epimerase/dehydratase [Trichococcus]CZR09076.1 polysaccharide biosynthesis protein [Trichococcus sp. ES5]SHG08119.1 CoA-binding domain-containing protein [Trichococcus flocculiformis]
MRLTRGQKAFILMFVDSLFILFSAFLAHFMVEAYIRPENNFYYVMIGVSILVYLGFGVRNHLFSRIIRYTSMYEILRAVISMTVSFAVSGLISILFIRSVSYRYIFLMYAFSLLLIPGSRVLWRLYHEYKSGQSFKGTNKEDKIRTLIVGAGDGGNLFISNLTKRPGEVDIIGIVDQDPGKQDSLLFDIPVLGTEEDIPALVREYKIDQVTIAIPSATPDDLERIIAHCSAVDVKVNQMPSIEDVLKGKLSVNRFRDIDVVDLLGREEVQLDKSTIAEQLHGKVVLVSGAGGSIGSEVCRQVAKFEPAKLILLGHGENSIYLIDKELRNLYGRSIEIVPVIADIQDRKRIFSIMEKFKPDQVYHAAAHKHVPLMEYNPTESIKNNVYGTKNIAEAAKSVGVKSFVMISTDKAVRPTNVMGSTKRIAEMIVTALNEPGKTKFAAVRFGNVLGSRGSVIPVFREQIANGGPVTVTDFRMIRYFMTIPEASRLVIQAGVLAKGGEIFILDMGEPVRIVDLAKKMIRLSGFTEADIPILETGIRPGEKLYEELLADGQLSEQQVFEKIFVGNSTKYKLDETMAFVENILSQPDDIIREKLVKYANEHE